MKNFLLYISIIALSLLFTACGGGGSSSPINTGEVNLDNDFTIVPATNKTEDNNTDLMKPTSLGDLINMEINITYIMQEGDSIIKISDTPKIVITTNIDTGITTATLISGIAKIKEDSLPAFF